MVFNLLESIRNKKAKGLKKEIARHFRINKDK
jgi:hypothetical protein